MKGQRIDSIPMPSPEHASIKTGAMDRGKALGVLEIGLGDATSESAVHRENRINNYKRRGRKDNLSPRRRLIRSSRAKPLSRSFSALIFQNGG